MRLLRLRDEAVRWRAIGAEIVAVDLVSSTYLSTNASGSLLWHRLGSGASRQDLVEALADGFGIGLELAAANVDRFVSELDARDLLEP